MALALPKSKLYEANSQSTSVWQSDLKKLFHHARERYADVVWKVIAEGETEGEEVYGHKAIVYARAPTTFQATYFSFRHAPPATPDPYGPDQSSYSLHIDPPSPSESLMRDYDHLRGGSPAPSQMHGTLLRLTTSINPALLSNELEYLYTAQGMGEAFEFLFDAPEQRNFNESEEDRMDKLRRDLCYMWRSRLYSDVRIALTGDFPDAPPDADDKAGVFFSHRFILVSRSPYFHKALQPSFQPSTAPIDGTTLTLELPSTAFTPSSLHWAFGFMYTGTLNFSHRTFDLETAFAIVRSAQYLLIATMRVEIEAHIVEEMVHGLFHAYLTFDEYEKITAGKWGVGGCRCRQCRRRVPRVLEFALAPDISNKILERGSRRALIGMFGEGWCSSEFANLSTELRAFLLKGVEKRTTPQNLFPLLFAAEAALARLEMVNDIWAETVEELIVKARKTIDEVLCDSSESVFEQQEWLEIMESDGAQFQDMDRVEWIMQSLVRGLKDINAPRVYQTVVSAILLRPHPTDAVATLLPSQSPVRSRVESTRTQILGWIKKQRMNIRMVSGFDTIERWTLKEIAHELEMNIQDLKNGTSTKGAATRTGLRETLPKDKLEQDMEALNITTTSMRANVLNRNMATLNEPQRKDAVQSSIRSHPYEIKARNSNGDAERDSFATSTSSLSSARSLMYPDVELPTASTPATPKLTGATLSRSDHLATASEDHRARSPTVSTNPPAGDVSGRRVIATSTTSAADSSAAGRPKSIAASVKSSITTTSIIQQQQQVPTAARVNSMEWQSAKFEQLGATRPEFFGVDISEITHETDPYDLTGQVDIQDMNPKFKGNYSSVFQGGLNDKPVAVKVIQSRAKTSTIRRKILREKTVWILMKHPNILPFYGYTDGLTIGQLKTPFGALISPWYENGDAGKFLEEHGERLSKDDRTALWKSVIDGVTYLHQHQPAIIHGDLKPGNVIIDDSGCPRICDFGLAQIFYDEPGSGMTTTTEHTGTDRYLAPELLTEDVDIRPTAASDVYALGCLGLEFIYLQMPYSHRRNNLRGFIYMDIKKGIPPATDCDIQSSLTWSMIKSCWDRRPEARPSAFIMANILATSMPIRTAET